MKLTRLLTLFISAFIPAMLHAQFYVTGDDPGRLRWFSMDTDNFRIIYPEGNDSLARIYGCNLEKFRIPVSRTTGYLPGGPGSPTKTRMPVVLHTWNGENGSVAWAPKRMDLFTIPSAYSPEPFPWATQLAVHESRHVTQMQFGRTKVLNAGNYLFGQMWNILVSLIYPGLATMEGDAVIAETALTQSGRGRTSDFLNYYRVAFDSGVERSWHQWRYQSQRNYGPNHYALGYMTAGGFRYLYDCPYYMSDSYHLAARRPYNFWAFNTTLKNASGLKFKQAFKEVCDSLGTMWKQEADARKPYICSEQVTPVPKLYTEYKSNIFIGKDLYSIKSGFIDTPVLVRIDENGREKPIRRLASNISMIRGSDSTGRILWSETKSDVRWSLKTDSDIRYMDMMTGKKKKLQSSRLSYNPSPSPSGKQAAVVEYKVKGGSALAIIDIDTGKRNTFIEAPDSLQLIETVWIEDTIYASAVSDNGYGIYSICFAETPSSPHTSFSGEDTEWKTVLAPQPVMVKNLGSYGHLVTFTCDRTGVNELYHLDAQSGKLKQKTSIRHGGSDFTYSPDGKYLYYSSQTVKGRLLYRTPVNSLIDRDVDFTVFHRYALAEKLAQQEKDAAARDTSAHIPDGQDDGNVSFSDPKPYRKFPNAFYLHSWAPVYVSVNNIMNMSFDHIWQAASAGVSGIMQNRLSTAVGEFGYSAHKDPYDKSYWRHSGHVKFTYSGLYPVFELSVDFNDRAARQYGRVRYIKNGTHWASGIYSTATDNPYIQGNLKVYIPFNFSSGGWYRGVIPQVSYTIGNDRFDTSLELMDIRNDITINEDGVPEIHKKNVPIARTSGRNNIRQHISGAIRAYSVLGTANSAVYPRWGAGVEIGASGGIECSRWLSPMGYVYAYGYLPGVVPQQGFKLTAMWQRKLYPDAWSGQTLVNILPRGLNSNSILSSYLSINNTNLFRFTADYAIPIYIGDIAVLGSLFFIKRLVFTPHFDLSLAEKKPILFSTGASLTVNLESILTIEWPCSIGVTYSYNGGFRDSFSSLQNNLGRKIGHHYVGPVFNVSF